MSLTNKSLILLMPLLFFLTLEGCIPTKQARVAAVAYTADDVRRAAFKQADSTIVRAGTPAYLMLVDGLIEAYPDNTELLTVGCQAYTGYAASFIEDEDRVQAAALYARGKDYGFRALSTRGDFQQAASGSVDDFVFFLQQFNNQDVPALFWTASAWAKWISLSLDNIQALADMPMLEATMKRVIELDDSFFYGSPHLLMGVYLAVKPEIVGGNITAAKEHFDKAFSLGADKLLTAKVMYAKYYAVRLRDRSLFERTLQEVIAAPAAAVPELTLSNSLAKEKASKMLENMDEYFVELQ